MRGLNRRMPPMPLSRFGAIARADVPRSKFNLIHGHTTTFQTGYLIPIAVYECLPGDAWHIQMDVFARLATLGFPIMDDVWVESWGFFTPNRLVWSNFTKQMGEQEDPDDSISYLTPQVTSPTAGWENFSLFDYMGLPTVGQVPGQDVSVSALPLRMHNLIYNEYFRDENLQDSLPVPLGDGPDSTVDYNKMYRNKQHDWFTSCLPWPQKGGTAVSIPLAGDARIRGLGLTGTLGGVTAPPPTITQTPDIDPGSPTLLLTGPVVPAYDGATPGNNLWIAHDTGEPQIYADLSSATGASINALRQAFAIQQFLEKDARGGTRYTELLVSHFGVMAEDFRLQRPEYIGGGKSSIQVHAIPNTAAPSGTLTAPLGNLGATATMADRHRFSHYCSEHGSIIILVQVTAPKRYFQGIDKMWDRQTRYDYFWNTFAHLGEQAVLRREIYVSGDPTTDNVVFGYNERYGEYRFKNSLVTSWFKTYKTQNIDEWGLWQYFGSAPALNETFLRDALPFNRVFAAGDSADNQQVLWDSKFTANVVRAMPIRGTPGLRVL